MAYFLTLGEYEIKKFKREKMMIRITLCFILMISFMPLSTYGADENNPEISGNASVSFFNDESWSRYGSKMRTNDDIDGTDHITSAPISIPVYKNVRIAPLTYESLIRDHAKEAFEGVSEDSGFHTEKSTFYGGITLSLSF